MANGWTGRTRRRLAQAVGLVASVALVVAVVVWIEDDDRGEVAATDDALSTPLPPERELFLPLTTSVGGELWVFGGLSGPDGSSPPSTDMLPEGWGANDLVLVYGPDARLRHSITLPGLSTQSLVLGRVLEVDDEHYLLGNVCSGLASIGCSSSVDPVLFHIDAEAGEARRIELSLPALPPTQEIGVGALSVLGIDERGVAWVTQRVPVMTPWPVQPARVLGIDVRTGLGREIALPEGHFETGTFCFADGTLYATRAELSGSGATRVEILERPAAPVGDWQTLAEPPLDQGEVYRGGLTCLESGELVLEFLQTGGHSLTPISMETGAMGEPRVGGGTLVGHVGGRSVFTRVEDSGTRTIFVRHEGSWRESSTTLSRDVHPVVFAGELRDAASVLGSTRPNAQSMPVIEF